MSDKSQIDEIKFNAENLWKEESFTDLEVEASENYLRLIQMEVMILVESLHLPPQQTS